MVLPQWYNHLIYILYGVCQQIIYLSLAVLYLHFGYVDINFGWSSKRDITCIQVTYHAQSCQIHPHVESGEK